MQRKMTGNICIVLTRRGCKLMTGHRCKLMTGHRCKLMAGHRCKLVAVFILGCLLFTLLTTILRVDVTLTLTLYGQPYHLTFQENDSRRNDSFLKKAIFQECNKILPSFRHFYGYTTKSNNGTDVRKFTKDRTSHRDMREREKLSSSEIRTEDVDPILHMKVPTFLANYKNPCWYETLEPSSDVYQNNSYGKTLLTARHLFWRMNTIWRKRKRDDNKLTGVIRLRCLPYFYIIGQPKCASTDLYLRLTAHPEVVRMPIKEPHWWSKRRTDICTKQKVRYAFQHYVDLFDEVAYHIQKFAESRDLIKGYHPLITGDGSVSTMWHGRLSTLSENVHNVSCIDQHTEPILCTPFYLRHVQPQARLIAILRNPTDRLYSDYLYFAKEKTSADDFHGRVKHAVVIYRQCMSKHSLRVCAHKTEAIKRTKLRLNIGMYSVYLDEWLTAFDREQFHIIRMEDYSANTTAVLRDVFTFLRIGALADAEMNQILSLPKANMRNPQNTNAGDMLAQTRDLLNRFYLPFNHDLATMLHDNKYLWNR